MLFEKEYKIGIYGPNTSALGPGWRHFPEISSLSLWPPGRDINISALLQQTALIHLYIWNDRLGAKNHKYVIIVKVKCRPYRMLFIYICAYKHITDTRCSFTWTLVTATWYNLGTTSIFSCKLPKKIMYEKLSKISIFTDLTQRNVGFDIERAQISQHCYR